MHPFLMLREKLPPLSFDASLDVAATRQDFFKNYLKFYQLEFSNKICSGHYAGTFDAANYTIVAHYWLPALAESKGTLFLLHGYYDHVGLYRHAIQFGLEAGLAVVIYDQPGHGLSSGEQVRIDHFSEYVSVLQSCLSRCEKTFPKPWHGLGQSTGGAILLHALMIEKMINPFNTITLLAPLIKPAGWSKGVRRYYLVKFFAKKVRRDFLNNSCDKDFVRFCRETDPLQSKYLSVKWAGAMKEWLDSFPALSTISMRGLLIQGEEDQTVDWRYNLALIKDRVKGLEYYQLPEARHHLVNERDDLRQRVFTRMQQFLLASQQQQNQFVNA